MQYRSLGLGTTETVVGKWFRQNPEHRDKIVVATKLHQPMSDDVNDRGLSGRHE